MTARTPRQKDDRPDVLLVPADGYASDATRGVVRAGRQAYTYRFLLADGSTIDVISDRDDSDLRGAVVDRTGESIMGSTVLLAQPELGATSG